jgi:hypothetical protein
MFSKAVIFVASTLLAFVAASPAQSRTNGGDCQTGPVQCCNTVEDKDHLSPETIKALGLVNVLVGDIGAAVGANCNPVTVIGAGGAGCASAPVCCENNSFHGIVALGCVPVNVGL